MATDVDTGRALLGALVDGRPATTVCVLDRGLHYGDGVFETLAVRAGEAQLWSAHWERLARGCARLRLPVPDPRAVRDEARALADGAERAVLKILVTRGPGERGYRIAAGARPTRALLLYPAPDFPATHWSEGVAVRMCHTPIAVNPALAGIKHLNRLEQVLARAEWQDEGFAEGLMSDASGRVVCGTASNVFAVRGGALVTPDLADCGVEGVMRRSVLDAARDFGIAARTAPLRPEDLLEADEVFLTNSLFGVWPVRAIDGSVLRPGPVARRMARHLGPRTLAPAAAAP